MKIRLILSLFLLTSLLSGLLPGLLRAGPNIVGDQVLQTDTLWSGDILIQGVVVVGRKATLKIAPGTNIRFKKIDRNHDGIGDSEIRVLGRLLAIGTETSRIRFQSAEKQPAAKDWSYILVFTSGKKSEMRFCDFSHAFSGMQVHFSTVRISDCLFTGNHEGLRFGRADLEITRNAFTGNDTGIRFTRMEGPASIRNNSITQNRIGMFVAPSGQNIKDFFDPDQGGKAWNTGRLAINANNIHDNTSYDLSLGEKQLWNLDVTGNWWGTADPDEIQKRIFDQNRDSTLGQALYLPTAKTRFNSTETRGIH